MLDDLGVRKQRIERSANHGHCRDRSAVKKETPFVFDAKAVVVEGGKNREHDAKALLSDGKITVTENNDSVVAAIPYSTIVGLVHSNSTQPLWNSPNGPAQFVKVEGAWTGVVTANEVPFKVK